MSASLLAPFLKGFGFTLALITVIGAQNAFVLRQGILRQYSLLILIIICVSDAILITAGVLSMGKLMTGHTLFMASMSLVGFVFLVLYGGTAMASAIRGNNKLVVDAGQKKDNVWKVIFVLLAITYLNPHVYLDTIILVGGIGAQYPAPGHIYFIVGAILASCTWFTLITLGARALAPVFANPKAWRILDTSIALMMWGIAITLIWPWATQAAPRQALMQALSLT